MPAGACLDENSIVAFFESRLTPDAAARVDQHAATCESCRRVLAAYGGMAATASHRPDPISGVTARDARPADTTDLARLLAHAQAARRVGTVLCNKWRIDGILGMGGMAQVFVATHRNGRRVAVKMMRPELGVQPALVERFLREGYVANKVEHPGAVAVLDDDVAEDGAPFLVMELLEGRTLRSRLEEDGPLPVREALRLADQVLDVLAAAHEHGIVHRDIKPDNLFETADGTLKVLDFGIARLREQAVAQNQTQSGTTVGTIGYMPPEQARGRTSEVDARSDIWAIGATLFALLSGKSVHQADTPNEALLLAMTAPVPPLATLLPKLPAPVCTLLDTALRFDKKDRFADGRSMQAALREALGSLDVTESLPPSPPPPSVSVASPAPAGRGSMGKVAGGVVAVVLVVAAIAWSGLAAKAPPTRSIPSTTSPVEAALPIPTAAPAPPRPEPEASSRPEAPPSASVPPAQVRSAAKPPSARVEPKQETPRVAPPSPSPSSSPPPSPTVEERDPLAPRR